MVLPILVSLALGAVCASWLPLLPFAIIAVTASVAVAISAAIPGAGLSQVVLDAALIAATLQVGYVVGIFATLGLKSINSTSRGAKVPPELGSHAPPD